MPAIDADAHIDENDFTWEYLEESEKRFKPITFDLPDAEPIGPSDGRRHRLWLISGNARLRRFRSDEKSGTTQATRELLDPQARLRHMDELGIDAQALYPTTFLHAVTDKPEVEVALCKAYNRWLADRTANTQGRLRWVAQAPMLDMEAAVKELQFAKDHGACGVMKKGIECGDRSAADPYFHPLYEEAARLDMPICIHQGIGDPNSSNTTDGPAKMSILNVLSAFVSLAGNNIPDKFPGLRFGFVEAGASWIPFLIKELGMRGTADKADYDFKTGLLAHNRFYVTCDTEDDIGYLLNFGAEDYLMIGTDYSHVDQSAELRAHAVVMEQSQAGAFSPVAAQKIVSDNARRFYGF
jgi:predicted TIM-barrel fold metal-dependent hydrolase